VMVSSESYLIEEIPLHYWRKPYFGSTQSVISTLSDGETPFNIFNVFSIILRLDWQNLDAKIVKRNGNPPIH